MIPSAPSETSSIPLHLPTGGLQYQSAIFASSDGKKMSAIHLEDEGQMQEAEGAEAMVAPERSNIEVCLRIRPVPEQVEGIHVDKDERNVRFTVPRSFSQG